MWVRLVYVYDPNHPFQLGKVVSIRVDTPNKLNDLHKRSRIVAAPYKEHELGMAKACRITGKIDLTPAEIERLFAEGDRTVDVTTGKLRNIVDEEREIDFDRVTAAALLFDPLAAEALL